MEEKVKQILYKNNIIQPLKEFCAVIKDDNITKAAKKLFLTEVIILRQTQSLEKDSDFSLLDRKRI